MIKRIKGFMSKKLAAVLTAAIAFGTMAQSAFAAAPSTDTPVPMTGVVLPFSVGTMLQTATNFLGMYGQWIGLSLGVLFSPVLYGLAIKLIKSVRASSAKA